MFKLITAAFSYKFAVVHNQYAVGSYPCTGYIMRNDNGTWFHNGAAYPGSAD